MRPDVPGWCSTYPVSDRIITGTDGNLWFTMCPRGTIGRITPDGIMTEFTLGAQYAAPIDITVGPDGNLWFADEAQLEVGRLTLDGTVTRYRVPVVSGCFPSLRAITTGPDGNLWLTHDCDSGISQITPSGIITQYVLHPAMVAPDGITTGSDSNLWFTAAYNIGRITPGGTITRFPLPADWGQRPGDIIAGQDGHLWFVAGAGWIGRISLNGQFARYPTSLPRMYSRGIAVGPDGCVWYAEFDWLTRESKITRLDMHYFFLPLIVR